MIRCASRATPTPPLSSYTTVHCELPVPSPQNLTTSYPLFTSTLPFILPQTPLHTPTSSQNPPNTPPNQNPHSTPTPLPLKNPNYTTPSNSTPPKANNWSW